MHDRSFQILEAAVRDFIETGEPVSSGSLFHEYEFGIRPAMIRAELAWLTDEGYLEQPYHSAGRVPTNRGYEFFATRVLEEERPQAVRQELAAPFSHGDLADFLELLSNHLGIAAVASTARGEVRKDGLDELIGRVEWGPREEIMQIIRDFESIERRLAALKRDFFLQEFLDVFIGRKSPVTQSDELAVMGASYGKGDDRVLLFAIGPKRMDYEKAAAILKGLKDLSA